MPSRFTSWDDQKRTGILEKLVHGYPSHEYIIDYHELEEMGFDVNLFSDPERSAAQNVISAWNGQPITELVVPKKVPTEKKAKPEVVSS